jgi:hypothetical protein
MTSGHAKALTKKQYNVLKEELSTFRLDTFLRALDKNQTKNKGAILPFIRGLRFSALLIYEIRKTLDGTSLKVSWGHILDENGEYCSSECDIIIYKNGCYARWNGNESGCVMDFRFIEKKNAVAVISCKSYIKSSTVEKEYCINMKKYVDKVWLFAECCGPKSSKSIKTVAQNTGYEHFWHLYTWNQKTDDIDDCLDQWESFIKSIKELAN